MIFIYRYEYDAADQTLLAGPTERGLFADSDPRDRAFVLRSEQAAQALNGWPVRVSNLRVRTFVASVADRPSLLDLTTAQMLRSGAVTGAHE